ncbi:DNA cytosine methyltransferase [Enterococcus faecalis]|uniref:DNA cytosine methyltransferase n=1 Tax=Enterococcus faecalis TaxID=1351 RepID=UPI0007E54B7B|nr:DNA cytosine methyltransferase [Enterococcus faecalis]
MSYEQISIDLFFEDKNKIVRKPEKSPRLLSLFSGCGGLDLGFQQAGYNIVYSNDFDKDAQRVYRANLGEIDDRDILTIENDEFPECDILSAGFPCQPFSTAGSRLGISDERGNLYLECLRVINAKKPKVVIFENVRGILSIKNKDGSKLVDTIRESLEELGYNVQIKLLNASDYGVPQNRYRVFIVAFDSKYGKTFNFPEPIPKNDSQKVGSVIDVPKEVPNQVSWDFSPQAAGMIPFISEGGSWKDIPYEHLPERFKKIRDNMKKYRSPNFYRRFGRDEINGTITASAQPENCGILHPLEDRRYTIREVARFQSFPDDFVFFNETTSDIVGMYKVIGNAVPPKLAKVIADEILYQFWNHIEEEL